MQRVSDGAPYPLGATWDGLGVNFALFSAHAQRIELCLFDAAGQHEVERIALPCRTDDVWHVHIRDVYPGQIYGYRVYGPYDPQHGHRFNANKLLLDPYARRLHGRLHWHDSLYGYRIGSNRADLSFDRRDSARHMLKGVVAEPASRDGAGRPPRVPWSRTIIYEAHVKGLTQFHPEVPERIRGTFAALAHPAVIEHLVRLGITAVELLPVQAFVDDAFLVEKGLRNFWGYNSLGFMTPDPRYLGPGGLAAMRGAVAALHEAGIEVFLDVVYNHTAEGNHLGPTLSFKGIDNASYYRLSPENPRYYFDTTGCGNALDLSHPRVAQLVMDSLRYFVETFGIDGFRFDLASALARDPHNVDMGCGLFDAIRQDPVLAPVKMIAEPWDLGEGGYRLGGFPKGWSEWNDQFRDTIRSFWKGDAGKLPDLARVVAGSQETFEPSGRAPWASVNFVTAHDGFTLDDLVSFNDPRNEANRENNSDGHKHNLSWNHGHEGPSDDPAIAALRARQKRNMLATLMLAQGVPMLLAGDELSRSQRGNNNAYCQDNEISWLDWKGGLEKDPSLVDFVSRLIDMREEHVAFRRRIYFGGEVAEGELRDVYWLAPEGHEMTTEDWHREDLKALAMQFGNDAHDHKRVLVMFNAAAAPVHFVLSKTIGGRWRPILDTSIGNGLPRKTLPISPGQGIEIPARALLVLDSDTEAE